MCPIKLKPTMKIYFVEGCKLVVVHFSTHCQESFHHPKLDFVTVIAEIILTVLWQKFANYAPSYAPLCQHYALCFSSPIMPKIIPA